MNISAIGHILALAFIFYSAGTDAQPLCTVTGPDSVFFDKVEYNRYLPSAFSVEVTLINTASSQLDSVVIFPRSNPRFTVVPPSTVLLPGALKVGDTARADFTLIVNSRQTSGFDTVIISVSGKAGVRTQCTLPIWVEKEYRPVNEILCPPDSILSVAFVDSLDDYSPNPIAIPITVINHGDAPSKETRMFYVATEGVSPADGQASVLDVGTIKQNGGHIERTFFLHIVRRVADTTVELRFKVQGKGGLGDRIIDTICTQRLFIPAARDAYFAVECMNEINIVFEEGKYQPNPFQWKATIRNTGNAKAGNVRAFLSLPAAYRLDTSETQQKFVGILSPGETRAVSWLLWARPVSRPDTSEICVRAFDEFNRMAKCCDTLVLPAIRMPELTASCIMVPDSVFVNPQTGEYLPTDFNARILVQNVGTEAADSLWAELYLNDPDIAFTQPTESRVLLSQKLAAMDGSETSWRLTPRPVLAPRTITATFRIRGSNVDDVVSTCTIFIAAALLPSLECIASTNPDDTLHFNTTTLEYDQLRFTARVKNIGAIGARNVQATILLPPNISLPTGEAAVKYAPDGVLGIDSTWDISWRIQPGKQRVGVLDTIRVEFRSGAVRTVCEDWIFVIGIPPLTVLSIPSNSVERYGRELSVPIQIDNTDNKDINRLEITVTYDASKVEFTRFSQENSMLGSGWNVVSQSVPGRLIFVASSDSLPLQGEGNLLFMNFIVRFGLGDDILRVSGTELAFDSLSSSINNGSILVRYLNGYITVSGDCLYPLQARDDFIPLQNSPNPFNPSTVIAYRLFSPARVHLHVIDALGRIISTLVERDMPFGNHSHEFVARNLPSGVYLAVLTVNGRTVIRRMMLLR